MAHGVENSCAVICFLTQKYQDSKNCQAEFTYAKELGKTIIPVRMESKWRPSSWLGVSLAGALYIKRSTHSIESLTAEIVQWLQMSSSGQNIGNRTYNDASQLPQSKSVSNVPESKPEPSKPKPQEFAAPGTCKELDCKGRICAKCCECHDWHFSGDQDQWNWISNYENWREKDANRWERDEGDKLFTKCDGATCRRANASDSRYSSAVGGGRLTFHVSFDHLCLCDNH
ncbi:unnamed protein product [Adineta steineri]|uniref:TIR domain-containing protein n=1 Tax=Adineta steineri TaxID=433720 RepID=A0A814YP63_9BILA|nr:unnamed protein product [Adineta steineri]